MVKVALNREQFLQRTNKAFGYSFFFFAPALIAGALCSAKVKQSKDGDDISPIEKKIAYLHPFTQLILPFIDVGLAILSASICRLQPMLSLLPLALWNASNEYKSLDLTEELRKLKAQKEKSKSELEKKLLDSQIDDSTQQLNKTNALLGLFMKVFCLNFLFAPTYIPLIANIAGDTPYGEALPTKPLTKDIKSLGEYWDLMWNKNFLGRELIAFKRGLTLFDPRKWRGTLFGKNPRVEQLAEGKNIIQKMGLRLVGGSLKTILCTIIVLTRYLAGSLLMLSLPFVGMGALNRNSSSYTEEDLKRAEEHPFAEKVFELGDEIGNGGMFLNGIVPMMATTPSNIKSSGLPATICTTLFGIGSFLSGLADHFKLDPVIGRMFFYLANGFIKLGTSLGNLYRANKN